MMYDTYPPSSTTDFILLSIYYILGTLPGSADTRSKQNSLKALVYWPFKKKAISKQKSSIL